MEKFWNWYCKWGVYPVILVMVLLNVVGIQIANVIFGLVWPAWIAFWMIIVPIFLILLAFFLSFRIVSLSEWPEVLKALYLSILIIIFYIWCPIIL